MVLDYPVQVLRAATPIGLRLRGGCRTIPTTGLLVVSRRAERVHKLEILMMRTDSHCLLSLLLGLVRWRLLNAEGVRVRVEVVHVVRVIIVIGATCTLG